MTDDPHARLRAFLRQNRDAQARLLAELIKVPSDNPPGDCAPHAERTAELLTQLGFTIEKHPVPDKLLEQCGLRSITNLVARRRFGDGPTIALNAHGDVVPPGEGWSSDPYGADVREGMIYGRGAAVSKSDIATFAYAMLALQAGDTPIAGTVELHVTYDEETGGEVGVPWLLSEGIVKPDLAIAAGFSYGVVIAHNGCLHLEVELRGTSAHAAMPETGHDALVAATAVLSALYAQRGDFTNTVSEIAGIGSPSLTVGLIEGGINTNVVPDRVVFRLDRRMIPEEAPEAVEHDLRALIERTVAPHDGIDCRIDRIMLARPLLPLPGVERLAATLERHASAVLGEPIGRHGVPLYADARHYAAASIPTVMYGAGPRDILEANAHRADERVALSDLYAATEVVALALTDLLNASSPARWRKNASTSTP